MIYCVETLQYYVDIFPLSIAISEINSFERSEKGIKFQNLNFINAQFCFAYFEGNYFLSNAVFLFVELVVTSDT